MASARMLDLYSNTSLDLSSTGSNGTNIEPGSAGLNFHSLEVILGVSGIVVGMVSVLTFFCVKSHRSSGMQYSEFRMIMKKNSANSAWQSLSIPQLGVNREIDGEDLAKIDELGLLPFLKQLVASMVDQRVRNGEAVSSELAIEQVITVFMPKTDMSHLLGAHDIPLSVMAQYNPRNNRCNFFGKILQPLTQATLFFEISFGTIQRIGSLQLYPGILPVSRTANNNIALAQALLSAVFMLFMMYIGAAQAFMGDMGSSIDRFFIKSYERAKNYFTCAPVVIDPSLLAREPDSFALKCKIRLSQFVLGVFVLNNLLTEVESDYQQTVSLNERIGALQDSLIPVWIVYLCSMIEFGLNQLNDPIMLISEVYMGMTLIDLYFHRRTERVSASVTIEPENDEERAVPHSNTRALLRASVSLPLAARAGWRRLGQFSHRLHEEDGLAITTTRSLGAPLLAPATP